MNKRYLIVDLVDGNVIIKIGGMGYGGRRVLSVRYDKLRKGFWSIVV